MDTSYILTFIGDDRPGLVEQLSQVIENNNGSWHESRLSQLEGKFAGLVLISMTADNAGALEADLKALSASGLSVRVTPATGGVTSPSGHRITLSVVGPDRLGIVREISRALAQREINVEEMDSRVESAPMSAEMLFSAHIHARIPAATDLTDLAETLDDIAEQMTLDIDLET